MYFILLDKYNHFTWIMRPQETLSSFFVRKTYQQSAKLLTTVRQTLTRCDLERTLGGDTWCVKKLFE